MRMIRLIVAVLLILVLSSCIQIEFVGDRSGPAGIEVAISGVAIQSSEPSLEIDDPTETISPSSTVLTATSTSTITPTSTDTPVVSTPTEINLSIDATIELNANCRGGPDLIFGVIEYLYPGDLLHILGRNIDGNWLVTQKDGSALLCWVSETLIGLTTNEQVLLPIMTSPPTPTSTSIPSPTATKARIDPPTLTSTNTAPPPPTITLSPTVIPYP
jgi:hypothetical protein